MISLTAQEMLKLLVLIGRHGKEPHSAFMQIRGCRTVH
jgi:hypothetical protein